MKRKMAKWKSRCGLTLCKIGCALFLSVELRLMHSMALKKGLVSTNTWSRWIWAMACNRFKPLNASPENAAIRIKACELALLLYRHLLATVQGMLNNKLSKRR